MVDIANLGSVDSWPRKYNLLQIHPGVKKKRFHCAKMASRRQCAQLVLLQPALLSQLADHEALVLHWNGRLRFQAVRFTNKELGL